MKKTLLIIGGIFIIAGIIAVLFSLFCRFSFYSVLDGSASLYERLHRMMIISASAGSLSVLAGLVCLIIRSKIQ